MPPKNYYVNHKELDPNNTRENFDPELLIEIFRTQIIDVLKNTSWLDLRWLSWEINNAFLKFLEEIRLQWGKNEQKVNYLKKIIAMIKSTPYKTTEEQQRFFFYCFRKFIINFFEPYILWINNSIPKTSLNEYRHFTIWEKLLHNWYIGKLWQDKLCEWWNHFYRTLLLYNIFKELKNSWLDIDIKIFRFKNYRN